MDLRDAQVAFKHVLQQLKCDESRERFLRWVETNYPSNDDSDAGEMAVANQRLDAIAEHLRGVMPPTGMLETENVLPPASCDVKHTVHVDAFLYGNSAVDDLFERGELPKFYCSNCDSRNVRPLTLISHSVSQEQLAFIFQSLLPPLADKTVVDVGSRLGAVLYGAYVFSSAARIVGIELNQSFCQIQQDVVSRYSLQDRIRVLHGDLTSFAEFLQSADVVILHNVFEYFLSKDEEVFRWNFLQTVIRKSGTLVVAIPDLRVMLENVKIDVDQFLSKWVVRLPVDEVMSANDSASELSDITLYQVL